MNELPPLRPHEAQRLIRSIIEEGVVFVSPHARKEMLRDGADENDVVNVLRGGWLSEAEWENGQWRHRVETSRFCLVVHVETETRLVVVTGWRKK